MTAACKYLFSPAENTVFSRTEGVALERSLTRSSLGVRRSSYFLKGTQIDLLSGAGSFLKHFLLISTFCMDVSGKKIESLSKERNPYLVTFLTIKVKLLILWILITKILSNGHGGLVGNFVLCERNIGPLIILLEHVKTRCEKSCSLHLDDLCPNACHNKSLLFRTGQRLLFSVDLAASEVVPIVELFIIGTAFKFKVFEIYGIAERLLDDESPFLRLNDVLGGRWIDINRLLHPLHKVFFGDFPALDCNTYIGPSPTAKLSVGFLLVRSCFLLDDLFICKSRDLAA